MKVWLFQTGEPMPVDDGNARPMRAINLSNKLIELGHEVKIITTDFDHFSKKARGLAFGSLRLNEALTLDFIGSPGYTKNIGIGRLIDHWRLSRNLKKYLQESESKPDVFFVGFPPIECAWVIIKWSMKNNIPTLVDVKDLWPEVFYSRSPHLFRPILKIFTFPLRLISRKVYRSATAISTISDQFLSWILQTIPRIQKPWDLVAPLTSPKKVVSEELWNEGLEYWNERGLEKNRLQPIIYFAGSINGSFDFQTILKVAHLMPEVTFVIAGEGSAQRGLIQNAGRLENVILPGWITELQLEVLASLSKLSICPYVNHLDFEMSLPNKFLDAMRFGKPILTTLKGHAGNLIETFQCGKTYDICSADSLFRVLNSTLNNPGEIDFMGQNALNLYRDKFDFDRIYGRLVENLSLLSQKDNHD